LILRVYTACPGCDTPTMLRIGVGVEPGERQPFSVRCPQCGSTIRGQLITTEDADVSAQLEEGELLPGSASEDWQVITTHPAFPFVPSTERSPFLDITVVLGDASMPYFQAVGEFEGMARDWPQLERAFQFYLAEDWSRFDTAMSRLLEGNWPEEPDMVVRHDLVHRLLTIMIFSLDPSGVYADMQKEIWQRAEPSDQLVAYIRQPSVQSWFVALQKRLFRQISHLIEIRRMWSPALPFLWANRLGIDMPDDWRLPGDDFAILRGAYQQDFELSCQALPMLVVAENAADGREAENIRVDGEPTPWIPPNLPGSAKRPRTVAQFKKLNAEAKETFLDRFPVTEAGWFGAFDRGIRNAIAHADTDEVVTTGEITTGKGIIISYLAFVESVVKQLQLLTLWLNLAKLFRVYGFLDSQAGKAGGAPTQTS
jgi:hypothetical protein